MNLREAQELSDSPAQTVTQLSPYTARMVVLVLVRDIQERLERMEQDIESIKRHTGPRNPCGPTL